MSKPASIEQPITLWIAFEAIFDLMWQLVISQAHVVARTMQSDLDVHSLRLMST
jgi:hypothetical protein